MRIRFHNRAVNFLDKLDEKEKERIRLKLKTLLDAIESQGLIPFEELDIKRLEGEWKGFLRMRIARIRVIFCIDKEHDVVLVYEIDHRVDVYK